MLTSSGIQCRVVCIWADVSEKHHLHLQGHKSTEQGTNMQQVARQNIPEDGNIRNYCCENIKYYNILISLNWL
jgi:hypothetical protein